MFRKPIESPQQDSSLSQMLNAAIDVYLSDEPKHFWRGKTGNERASQYKAKIAGKNDFNLLCKVYLDVTAKQSDGDLSGSTELRARLMQALCVYLKITPEKMSEYTLTQALFERFTLSTLEWGVYFRNYEHEHVKNNAMYRDSFSFTQLSSQNLASQAKVDFVREKLSENEIELCLFKKK